MSSSDILGNKLKRKVYLSFVSTDDKTRDQLVKTITNHLFRNSNNDKKNIPTDKSPNPLDRGSFTSWAINVIRESQYLKSKIKVESEENKLVLELLDKSKNNIAELESNFEKLIENKKLSSGWNMVEGENNRLEHLDELLRYPKVVETLKRPIKSVSDKVIKSIRDLSDETKKDSFISIDKIKDKSKLFKGSFGFTTDELKLSDFAIDLFRQIDKSKNK